MGNLAEDTAVAGGDGRYTAKLNEDWAIWGPNGGYLAAVALRAAGAHTSVAGGAPRPASLVCHFLGVAEFSEVELSVVTLRGSRRAESMRVSMTQGGAPVLEALVWAAADGLDGMAHDAWPAPSAPRPEALPSADDLRDPADVVYPFWRNVDLRPTAWENWRTRPAGEPAVVQWCSFRPQAAFDDPFVDAGRLAVLVDTFQWPAATRAYTADALRHMAPSIDLACRFHRGVSASEWLLVEARSPVAAGGLVGGSAAVWDEAGRLVASGGQQMLCRPAPPPA